MSRSPVRTAARVLAWLVLVAGVGSAVAGVLLLTAYAPPSTVTATTRLDADRGVAVVTDPGVLQLMGGSADVEVRGEGQVFLATARAADADAWLGDATRTRVTGVTGTPDDAGLRTEREGAAAAVDPRSADVWLSSAEGDGGATLTVATSGEQVPEEGGGLVVVAATDGVAAGPDVLTLSWEATGSATEHPAARPLLTGGAAGALVGVLALVLLRTRRRRGGRRRRDAPAEPATTGPTATTEQERDQ